jgi:hypothetical protein
MHAPFLQKGQHISEKNKYHGDSGWCRIIHMQAIGFKGRKICIDPNGQNHVFLLSFVYCVLLSILGRKERGGTKRDHILFFVVSFM